LFATARRREVDHPLTSVGRIGRDGDESILLQWRSSRLR
jgi:hypothetical protein